MLVAFRGEAGLSPEPSPPPVKSAARALALVEFVAAEGKTSFMDILRSLGLPRSSTHELLQTLTSTGWLEHDPRSKLYSLGLRAWQVGELYRGHRNLADIAKPVMDRLAHTVGETVQLARLDGIENVYIAISESEQAMRLASRVGGRLLAHATGLGKALLSMVEPSDVERRLRSLQLPQYTEKTITDVDRLMVIIGEARRNGYALDDEEYMSGCRCVAVPLTDEESGVLSAMSISMPTSRTDEGWPESFMIPLATAAHEIRSVLGVSEPKLPTISVSS